MSKSDTQHGEALDVEPDAETGTHVNSRVPRREDFAILTDRQDYQHDRNPDDAVHAAYVRSPHAHARIVDIDTSAAEAHPDCELVMTCADYQEAGYDPLLGGVGEWVEWPLADDAVHYVGQVVAMVVAEDRYVAEDVAELVDVEYEQLDPVVDVMEARTDETVLHEDYGTNVANNEVYSFGDVDQAFEEADHVIETEIDWSGRASGVPLETPGVLAEYHPEDGAETFQVWANQHMHTWADVAIFSALGVARDEFRLSVPHTIGGSFGTKQQTVYRHVVLASVAAKLTNRPVKYTEDRVEDLQGGDSSSSDRHYEVKLAVDDDGTFQAMDMWFADNYGAYPRFVVTSQTVKPLCAVNGPYDIDHLRYEYETVVTNKQPQCAYRGFGVPAQNFVWETVVDEAADQLDMDPTELRLQNYIEPDQMPYQLPSKNYYDSGDYPSMLQEVWAMAEEAERDGGLLDPDRIEELREEGIYRGAAPTVVLDPGAGGYDYHDRHYLPDDVLDQMTPEHRDIEDVDQIPEPMELEVRSDGKVRAQVSSESGGQGHDTVVAQLLADELEVDPDDIDVRSAPDNLDVPAHVGPVASRTAVVISGAAVGAAEVLKEQLEDLAADMWNCDDAEVTYKDGGVERIGGQASLSLAELSQAENLGDIGDNMTPITSERRTVADFEYDEPGLNHPEYFGEALIRKLPVYPTTSVSANVPIVDVDVETGEIDVRKLYTLKDAGTQINPDFVEGQYHGGIAQGLGATLQEEFGYTEDGQPQTVTFFDMMLPSVENMPEIELEHSETPSPFTTAGIKGAGESGILDIPASVGRAINDALAPLDVRVQEIPASSDRVREWIKESPADAAGD